MGQKHYLCGYHAVTAAVETMPQDVRQLYLQPKERDQRFQKLVIMAEQQGVNIQYVSKEQIANLAPSANHQGVIAEVTYTGEYSESYLNVLLDRYGEQIFLLILDGVQDPHNLGACLRSANAFGVHAVIVPKDRACGITPTVAKVASGAVGVTPLIQVTNLSRTINLLKKRNVWVYGACEEASTELSQLRLSAPGAFVLGAEGAGMRRLTKENCDLLFKIPMYGSVQDLNVSVAVGIVLYSVKQLVG